MTLIIMELIMIKLTNLQQITTLPITTTLQEQIKSILTEPFHDDVETQQAWDELQCELWFLTSKSELSAAVEDSGKGIYMLMPKTLLTELRQYFSIEND